MRTVNMHEAKAQLSKLVDLAAKGEPFVIAKAGRPLVQVTAIEPSPEHKPKRIGFMQGEFTVPDDFDEMGRAEIGKLFGISS